MKSSSNEKICHVENSILLIIDIQERLASAMPSNILDDVIKNTNILVQAANELGIPVIHSEQYPKGLGNTVTSITDNLAKNSHNITKTSFSCSNADGFNDLIVKQKRQQIIITGIESHICVLQSALQLQRQGYSVHVVEDAVCSRKKLNHKNALARLRQNDITINNVESVLFEWLRDASHPKFKILSKLIK